MQQHFTNTEDISKELTSDDHIDALYFSSVAYLVFFHLHGHLPILLSLAGCNIPWYN